MPDLFPATRELLGRRIFTGYSVAIAELEAAERIIEAAERVAFHYGVSFLGSVGADLGRLKRELDALPRREEPE